MGDLDVVYLGALSAVWNIVYMALRMIKEGILKQWRKGVEELGVKTFRGGL